MYCIHTCYFDICTHHGMAKLSYLTYVLPCVLFCGENTLNLLLKLHFFLFGVGMCMHLVCRRNQRATCGNLYSPFATWILRVKCRSSGLAAKPLPSEPSLDQKPPII